MFQSSINTSEKKYNKEVWAQLPISCIRERNHYTSKLNCLFKSGIISLLGPGNTVYINYSVIKKAKIQSLEIG